MKRFALLIFVLVCFSLTAFAADVPAGDVFGGFQFDHLNDPADPPSITLYGWQASTAVNLHKTVGVVADFGGTYKTDQQGVKIKDFSYLFGPRFNFRQDKVTYFAEALYGGSHVGATATGLNASENDFTMAYGGGVDVKAGRVMIRVIEFDWAPVRSQLSGAQHWIKNNTRYGFGVVVPFGKK
jgi:hypothetical protein